MDLLCRSSFNAGMLSMDFFSVGSGVLSRTETIMGHEGVPRTTSVIGRGFENNGDKISPHGAVQERHKFPGFLRVPIASLQGTAVRPLPCNYDVFELVCALSRR